MYAAPGGALTLVYLHGFASGPGSTKAAWMRARLAPHGVRLTVPDLAPDFTGMTVGGMLDVARAAIGDGPAVVIGSSLGGWLGTLLAQHHPERVRGLVLLAPAFDFAARWSARLGEATLTRWRARGTLDVFHYAHDRVVPLGVRFLDEARVWPGRPDPVCPALVHAGRRDDTVPLDTIVPFTAARAGRELAVWDDGHELNAVLEPLWARTVPFLTACGVPIS